MRTIRAAFWVAGLVLFAGMLVFITHVSSDCHEFSQYNTGWNGTSGFFSGLDRHRVERISDTGQLATPRTNATLLIIAPSRTPGPEEISAYRSFLGQGNRIVLADDFGTGNAILKGLKSRISILPGNLSSMDRGYSDLYSVIAYRSETGNLPADVNSVLLNRPAALAGGTPMLSSSVMSWIDLNGNRKIDDDEQLGSYEVMASDPLFGDRLIVLSDPSVFINTMTDAGEPYDNRMLIHNLTAGDGPLLIDETNSRTSDAGGIGEILHVLKTTDIVKAVLSGVLVLIVVLLWRRMGVRKI